MTTMMTDLFIDLFNPIMNSIEISCQIVGEIKISWSVPRDLTFIYCVFYIPHIQTQRCGRPILYCPRTKNI
jgi:hypothetical protein